MKLIKNLHNNATKHNVKFGKELKIALRVPKLLPVIGVPFDFRLAKSALMPFLICHNLPVFVGIKCSFKLYYDSERMLA